MLGGGDGCSRRRSISVDRAGGAVHGRGAGTRRCRRRPTTSASSSPPPTRGSRSGFGARSSSATPISTTTSRIEGNEVNYSNFYLRRARVWLAGNAFDPRFTYFIHIQLEPTATVNLHDCWLEYTFSDLVILGAGRNKIPYGLEFLNSGFGLQFVERSVFSGETDIDIGQGPTYPGGGTARFGLRARGADRLRHRRHEPVPVAGRFRCAACEAALTGPPSSTRSACGRVGAPSACPTWTTAICSRCGSATTPGGGSTPGSSRTSRRRRGWRLGVLGSAYANSNISGGAYNESGYNLAVVNRYRGLSIDAEWGTEHFDFDALDGGLRPRRAGASRPVTSSCRRRSSWWPATPRSSALPTRRYRGATDSGLGVADVLVDGEYRPSHRGHDLGADRRGQLVHQRGPPPQAAVRRVAAAARVRRGPERGDRRRAHSDRRARRPGGLPLPSDGAARLLARKHHELSAAAADLRAISALRCSPSSTYCQVRLRRLAAQRPELARISAPSRRDPMIHPGWQRAGPRPSRRCALDRRGGLCPTRC